MTLPFYNFPMITIHPYLNNLKFENVCVEKSKRVVMKVDGQESFKFSIRPYPISEFMIVILGFLPSVFDRPLLTAHFALENLPSDLIVEILHNNFPANIFICSFWFFA